MIKRGVWLAAAIVVLAVGVVALLGAQSNETQDVTIQDLLDLLVTEDGQSRLDIIEAMIEEIEHEVDVIHSVAERMLQEQYGFFEAEEWTLSDIKFQLNQIEAQLDAIESCCCTP